MPMDINKLEVDIQNLKDQNVLDFERDKLLTKQIEDINNEIALLKKKINLIIDTLLKKEDTQ